MSKQSENVFLEAITGFTKKVTGNSWCGFAKPRSCLINPVVFNDEATRSVDEGRMVDTIHFVFNEAVDVIFHGILASKLGWYCLQGRTTRWVKNLLGCQALWVAVNGSYSAWRLVTSEAPQECILGLVLSTMFTNNRRW